MLCAGLVEATGKGWGSIKYSSFNSWQKLCNDVGENAPTEHEAKTRLENCATKGLTSNGLSMLDMSLNNGVLLRRYSRNQHKQKSEL